MPGFPPTTVRPLLSVCRDVRIEAVTQLVDAHTPSRYRDPARNGSGGVVTLALGRAGPLNGDRVRQRAAIKRWGGCWGWDRNVNCTIH